MPQDVVRQRCLHQPKGILRRNRPCRNRRLHSVVPRERNRIQRRNRRRKCLRVARRTRCMLILPPHVQRERSLLRQCRKARNVVEPRLVGSAVVVEERLPKVEAILQNWPRNPHHPRIHRLHSVHRPALRPRNLLAGNPFVGQLIHQRRQDILRLRIVASEDRVFARLQHVQRAPPRIRPHRQVHCVQISQRIQPHHRRIHPAIHRNIRASQRIAPRAPRLLRSPSRSIRRHRRVRILRCWRVRSHHRRRCLLRSRQSLGSGRARPCRGSRRRCAVRRLLLVRRLCLPRLALPVARHRLNLVLILLSWRGNCCRRSGRLLRSRRCCLRGASGPQTQAQTRNANKQQRNSCPHSHLETPVHQPLQCNCARTSTAHIPRSDRHFSPNQIIRKHKSCDPKRSRRTCHPTHSVNTVGRYPPIILTVH